MLVWYAGYGSNLESARFLRYLSGGRPAGAARDTPGARDPAPAREERAVVLAGSMFFGWESPTWGGGIAFLDAEAEGTTYARAFLITEQQLSDVAAQEMHRAPGDDLDLAQVLENRRHSLGPGRYETVHLVGELDGLPVLTFTVDRPERLARNAPVAGYLSRVVRGLDQTHHLGGEQTSAYLRQRPGMEAWGYDELDDLVRNVLNQPGQTGA